MALQNILDTISNNAAKDVAKIKESGAQKINEAERETSAFIDLERKRLFELEHKRNQARIDQVKMQQEMQVNSALLTKKKELLDSLYQAALEKLSSLSPEQETDLLQKIIAKLPQLGDGEIIAAKGKESVISTALNNSGLPYRLSADTTEAKGGFILRSANFEVNNTYENLLADVRSETEGEVAKIIFA